MILDGREGRDLLQYSLSTGALGVGAHVMQDDASILTGDT